MATLSGCFGILQKTENKKNVKNRILIKILIIKIS